MSLARATATKQRRNDYSDLGMHERRSADPCLKVGNYICSPPAPYSRAIIRGRQVYGTHNLRVVDLSILPLHIGAPTQGTALPLFPCLCMC